MRAIGTMANTEITKESSIATRPPSFVTNPMVALATPLVSWGVSKAADMAGGFRDANGALTTKSVLRGLSPYAAILPLGLAYAAMRDEFDEEVLGKKANVSGYGGSSDPWLVTLDRLGRVGTFGTFGDVANAALNRDTNRDFSVDSRVFFVSSLLSALSAAGTAWRQGQVDYANVGRPLAQAFGGSGYLQYADGLNHILGMDNAESRVVARINVNNYLRVAGRELKMDVRTSKGGKSLPTMTKPYVGQMIMAAYANDPTDFRDAYENAKAAAREEKHADPEQFVQRSYLAYHPLNAVFTTKRTDEEYARLLRQMGDEGKRAVSEAIHLFNRYAEQIYVKPPKLAKSEREVPAAAYFTPPSRLREARAAAGY